MKRFLPTVLLFTISVFAQATDPWAMMEQMQQRMSAMMGGMRADVPGQLTTQGPWDVRVDKNPVDAGEEFTLQFTVDTKQLEEHGSRGTPRFSVQNGFVLKGVDSSDVEVRSRRRITAKRYDFHLVAPRKTGNRSAGILSWEIGGREYDIFHLNGIEVKKSYDDAAVTVSLTPNKRTVYEGEQLFVTLSIHTYEHFQGNLVATNMDLGNDFIAHRADLSDLKLSPIPDAPRETSGNAKFAWISPVKTGQLSIPPFKFNYTKVGKPKVVEKKTNRGGFSMSFSSVEQNPEEAEALTAPVKINVLPLPAQGKPKDFSGMVGNYSFEASFDKDSLALGDALTLSVRISGDGKPGTITDPKLPDFPDFRTVPPENDIKKKISGGKVVTTKNIRIFLYPKKKGEFEIPEISYSWFNPSRKKYEVKTLGPWKIKVEKGENSSSATLAPNVSAYAPQVQTEIEDLGKDIRYIHAIRSVSTPKAPFYGTFLFWILLVLPFVLYGVLCRIVRSHRRHSGNAALVRKAKAKRNLKKCVAEAKLSLSKNDDKAVYAALEKGLIDYLSDLSNREFRGMTRERLKTNLSELGISDEAREKILAWLENCAYARFAPAAGSTSERTDALREFERLCDSLEVLK